MRAIIEIPNDMIRSAGSAIALDNPKLIDSAITAMERLANMEEMTLRFEDTGYQNEIESQVAMMCVSQIMYEIESKQV